MADEFLELFKKICELKISGQQTSIDDNLLQLNDPDLQRLMDAELDQADVEVLRLLTHSIAKSGDICNLINFGKLSDKDIKSAALKNILRSMRLSQQIQKKKEAIQKRNKLTEKDIALLNNLVAQKNTELDEKFKQKQQEVSLEIGKIMRNINSFSEKEKEMESTMDQDIKKLKADETRAKADMERKIEEKKKEFMKAEEATNKKILEMKEKEEKIKKIYDKKIQELKDNEAEIRKKLQQDEVEKTSELEAKLKEMKKDKAQEEEKTKNKIQAMQNILKFLEEE